MQHGTDTPTDRPISGWWLALRAALTVLVGPPLGTVAVLLVFVILAIPENLPSLGEFFATIWQILPVGSAIGAAPAVMGACAMALLAPWLHGWKITLAVAIVVGAIAGLLGSLLYGLVVTAELALPLALLLMAAGAGAFCLPVCTFGLDALLRRVRGPA